MARLDMSEWFPVPLRGKVGTSFAILAQKGPEWPVMRDQSSEGGFYAARKLFTVATGQRVRHEFIAHAPGLADVCPSAG
jgi:hypothetical protein